MKFRFTENWNKSIINHSLKRKLPTKTIMKKNNSIKKNTVKQSSLWSAICPRKRELQTKTIKKSYELKTKKENIKNKSFQTLKKGTYEAFKRSTSNMNKPHKVTTHRRRVSRSGRHPYQFRDHERNNVYPRKKQKEKKQFFAKLKKNGTKNGTYVPEAFKRSTSNMNNPQKVTTHTRRVSRHPYFRDYERKRDKSNDRFIAKLKKNARKKGANAKLKKSGTKKGAHVESFKRSSSNKKKARKVTNRKRRLSHSYFRNYERKRDESAKLIQTMEEGINQSRNRDQTMRDGISKSNIPKSQIEERNRERRERRIRRRQKRERKKEEKKKTKEKFFIKTIEKVLGYVISKVVLLTSKNFALLL